MKNWICVFALFFSVLTAVSMCYACNVALQNNTTSEKFYIPADKLLVTDHGLFLLNDKDALPLTAVFVDAKGIYIQLQLNGKMAENTCINGHPIYHQECAGCANWWCNSRCKCYSPWK